MNHRPVDCDEHELPRQTETGGASCPYNYSRTEGGSGCPGGSQVEVKTRKQNLGGHPWATTRSDVPERKHQVKIQTVDL